MKIFKLSFILFVTIFLYSCQKEYSAEHLRVPSGKWEFMNGSLKYSGYIDTVYQTSGGTSNQLFILGKTNDGNQSFQMEIFADTFAIGTYKASAFQTSFTYTTPVKTIFEAKQPIGEFIVHIISLDSTTISGTFSGTAKDSTNNLIQLTNGKFSVE